MLGVRPDENVSVPSVDLGRKFADRRCGKHHVVPSFCFAKLEEPNQCVCTVSCSVFCVLAQYNVHNEFETEWSIPIVDLIQHRVTRSHFRNVT